MSSADAPVAVTTDALRPPDILTFPRATPASQPSRVPRFAAMGGVAAVLLLIGVISALRLSGGGRTVNSATATPPGVSVGGQQLEASGAVTPTTNAVITPLQQPTATTPPTPVPTFTPVPPTFTPTPVPPTATPAPTFGVFGVGTTARNDLETVKDTDAVDTFTAGQDVYAFVNYDGAQAGKDTVDVTVIANGNAQTPQKVTLQKQAGFVYAPLGKLPAGDYQIEVRRNGALVGGQPKFQVAAPPTATPVPVVPRTNPATGGTSSSTGGTTPQNPPPVSRPASPTCAPGTC